MKSKWQQWSRYLFFLSLSHNVKHKNKDLLMIKTDHGNRRQLALRETAKVGCSLWKINKDSFRYLFFCD